MELTNKYKRVKLADIIVNRDERQRREIDTSDIRPSIEKFGVIQPIILTRDLVLVAGERRYQASKELDLYDIPCRFVDDLSPIEAQILELEENLKRKDLTWQDNARAVARLHKLYSDLNTDWSQTKTAEILSVSPSYISMITRVTSEMHDERITKASSLGAAFNMVSRRDERATSDALSDILEAGNNLFDRPKAENVHVSATALNAPTLVPVPAESLLNVDFVKWADTYTGKPFNFLHCDFPYGINVFGGPMSGKSEWTTYNDSPDVYWELIRVLCRNLDKLMSHSAHLMFWFSMEHYEATLAAFAELAPSLEFNKFPLVWFKSDNVGIMPDPKHGPRRVYETCLIALREDRPVVKPVGNAYSAPTDKRFHPSTKPEPVLRHFMQMFVDDNTRMLDPTCGSASSLRAAESLGAKQVLGLERDKEHFTNAQSALRSFRALRGAIKNGG